MSTAEKVALVTGAGSGIGRAVAVALLDAGWRVVLVGRRADALSETARLAESGGAEAIVIPADVSDPKAVDALFQGIAEKAGRLDVCFNNAGFFPHSLPIEAPLPDEEAASASVIEQAKVQAGRRVSGHSEKVRPGQAGRRIVEEATDMRATAIVMPLPRRVAGASVFGKTLETVLAERPCRVIIESSPDGARSMVTGERGS